LFSSTDSEEELWIGFFIKVGCPKINISYEIEMSPYSQKLIMYTHTGYFLWMTLSPKELPSLRV